jgi:hypothetical protein
MRKHVFVNLGLWHTYKHVSLLIWRKFGLILFAGLWHFMFPNSMYFPKPRLVAVTKIFTLLRLAYSGFKHQLIAALESETIHLQTRICLQNSQDLCEYFIPVVIFRIGEHVRVFFLL